ncbi:tRNA uridine-5-carboxymethylaminomethyl(34) synthesis GTPase MnmE [Candidatus Dependentiae bacterium]|nr:tRNA uridine-5-carboxymethylaminomethyl(34) synthesis GTPase MnmE [Candidatus Dependentiae bacterium]
MKNLYNLDDETIIARCTPSGSGALALIRLSGTDARLVANKICKLPDGDKLPDGNLLSKPSHTVHYGWIIDEVGKKIDQVLCILMDAPRTFTGQNIVEITCHNNPFIIEQIINLAIANGARLAQEGEFSKRAFLNGKIDLIQAEAINSLIGANTQFALKKTLGQLEGSFSSELEKIEKKLITSLAFCEASFEFLDEEAEFGDKIKQDIKLILVQIEKLKKAYDNQKQIREGIRIALIGSVNAGKSSIFNALLNQNRAIVTSIAGTTRDVIEAGLYKNGNYWTLVDTAGIRQTDDLIESEGIKKSLEEAKKADIIILTLDGSRNLTDQEEKMYQEIWQKHKNKIILTVNKSDLPIACKNELVKENHITISTQTRKNIDELENQIADKIENIFNLADSPFLLNKRQFNLLLGFEIKLKEILDSIDNAVQYEILSLQLKDAISYLSELTGKSVSEAALDAVFKEFCVGK